MRLLTSASSSLLSHSISEGWSAESARRLRRSRAFFVLAFLATAAAAQPQTDTLRGALPEIRIESTRGTSVGRAAPFAVAVVEHVQNGPQAVLRSSLAALTDGLPGFQAGDRGHFALGDRLLIRGSGARAAFGVRGLMVRLDGMPLTLPDGQSATEIVEPALVRRTELLRGPASLFWGNAAGGVLTMDSSPDRGISESTNVRLTGGSYGFRHMLAEVVRPLPRGRIQVYGSDLRQDGYRDHAAGRITRAGADLRTVVPSGVQLRATIRFVDQDVSNPGSLTLDQTKSDPRGADPRYVAQDASKASRQGMAGLQVSKVLGRSTLEAGGYALSRALTNPLTFAWIDLDRRAAGAWALLRGPVGLGEWIIDGELSAQRDERFNFGNDGGRRDGPARLDQREHVRAGGLMAGVTYPWIGPLSATLGLRWDRIRFDLDDRLLDNGDQTGERLFNALSPQIGLSLDFGDWVGYASIASGFETPTTTELVNRPDGLSGFNPLIDAQRMNSADIGIRLARARLHVDVAAFVENTDGLLQPAQDSSGRTFFRNAGEARGRGVEGTLRWRNRAGLEALVTGSVQHFQFAGDRDVEGNTVPGIAPAFGSVRISRNAGALSAGIEARAGAATEADDGNTLSVDGYVVADLFAGYRVRAGDQSAFWITAAVTNVSDTAYIGTIIVNARGGRIAEPSSGRAFRVGIAFAR